MSSVIQYSNQYLIARNDLEFPFPEWNQMPLDKYSLHTAPNLKTYSNDRITLLGFAVHVLHPEWDEEDILRSFPESEDEILKYIDHLCGIHLIIIDGKLYNDAAGVMKMFKYSVNGQLIAVSSDPKLLNEVSHLKKDSSQEANTFYNSDFFRKSCIRLGNLTQYENVEQVLPNHLLDLHQCKTKRYFPRVNKVDLSTDLALKNAHHYFSNVIQALDRKYKIKCSMTAGWDSRMVISMTKGIHDHVEYYTFMLPFFNTKHEDVKIPTKISASLKLDHKFISKDVKLDAYSLHALKSSYALMEYEHIDTYFGGFPKFRSDENVLLLGTVSEICKNYYDNVDISDGESFAKAAHFPVLPYTTSYFESKLSELKALEDQFGYDLRDLAHWEQDITNFAAKRTQYLYSFVRAFSPFNARIIITNILSVPRELRDKQQHEFYSLYLKKFYPELLQFPVNPSLKQKLIRLGKKVGIYGAYKKLSTQLRK